MARRPVRSRGGSAPRLPVWAVVALVLAAAVAAYVAQRGGGWSSGGDPTHERLPRAPSPPIPEVAPRAPTVEAPARERAPAPSPPPSALELEGLGDAEDRAAITAVARAIDRGGPFAYRKDGVTFENRERRLAVHPRGHWREYTVPTPGADSRGARRIVAGADGELFYTRDHYRTFVRIRGPTRR